MSQSGTYGGGGGGLVTPVSVPNGGTGIASITDHALIVGSGAADVTVLAAATDGQIPIGSTGADPVMATLTAGSGVSIVNAAGTITLSSTGAGVDQDFIYYVGKHGNDANDGLTVNKAFLTFGAAISAASAGDVIWCFDDGVYVENVTGVTGVSIHAVNAVLVGAHTISGDSGWSFLSFVVATGSTGITMSDVGKTASVIVGVITVSGTGVGFANTAGKLILQFGNATIENGFLIGNTTSDETFALFGTVEISGTGTAFATITGGELHLLGGEVKNIGAGDGTVFSASGGGTPKIDALITHINTEKLSNITAATGGNLTCSSIEGTAAESGAGKLKVSGATRIDDVPIGAITPSTGAFTTLTATTPIAVTSGGTGAATFTDHGILVGSGIAAVTPLAVGTNGQLLVGSTGADPIFTTMTSTDATIDIVGGAGTIDIDLSADVQMTGIHGWNGTLIESAAITVTAAAGTITLSVEKSGGGNLTAIFSDGFYTWVTAPDTITLTAGSDTSPQINYAYLLQSTKTLTVSTVGWPATEFVAIATVLCQSAASLQTDGAYKVHAWTDHVTNTVDQGHLPHINRWIREQNATWLTGVLQTLTITINGASPDNVIFTTASGNVLQLHEHTFPAFTGTPDVYTVNDSVTPYNIVTDLNALLTDSTGATMSARYFSLVIWGVVSEATGDCKLMVNLPGGSYGTESQLNADEQRYADFSIPSDFKGTGFLISQLNLRHQTASSGTWTSIDEIDLRGLFPSLAAGGTTSAQTVFEDNSFRIVDNGDVTKELAFEISPVTTATTRTITMDDRNIDMDAVPDSFTTDSGSAVPVAGVLTVAGGDNIDTSGAGSTVTISVSSAVADSFATDSGSAVPAAGVITFSGGTNVTTSGAGSTITINASAGGGGITWDIITADLDPMAVDTGYICNKSGLLTLTLPTTAAVGTVLRVTGINTDLGWLVEQSASQQVHFGDASTTSGVGGSLASTLKRDSIEMVCVVEDLEWNIVSSLGNITIV